MAVTTREYSLNQSRPKDVLQALHDAISDLNWFDTQPMGYLSTFTNTAGSTLAAKSNERYLVYPSSTTAPAGTGAVFDVFRTPVGAISAVTLITGGSGVQTAEVFAVVKEDMSGVNFYSDKDLINLIFEKDFSIPTSVDPEDYLLTLDYFQNYKKV